MHYYVKRNPAEPEETLSAVMPEWASSYRSTLDKDPGVGLLRFGCWCSATLGDVVCRGDERRFGMKRKMPTFDYPKFAEPLRNGRPRVRAQGGLRWPGLTSRPETQSGKEAG
jgi:hypothetical protein